MKKIALFAALLASTAMHASAQSKNPALVEAAQAEKKLVIYGSTDKSSAQYLLDDFKSLYPFINVEYNELGTGALNSRFTAEVAANQPTADILWSSAMDLQLKLVEDGLAQPHKTTEGRGLPTWANFKDQAYAVTLEPMVLVYNKRLVKPEDVPTTRAAFAKLVEAKGAALNGKIISFDPVQSGFGYTVLSNDANHIDGFWPLIKTLRKVNLTSYSSSGVQLEKINAGEHLYDYGISGAYVLDRQRKLKDLGFTYFQDGTTAFSRVIVIPKAARNPNSAKLFLDYLLSTRGQTLAATRAFMFSIKPEIAGLASYKNMLKQAGGLQNVKYIPLSSALVRP